MQSILSERQLDMSQCHSIHLFDSSMVRGGESLNAECTYLDCWKLFFFFHYSMLYCPVLIVKGVVLDRHCVCSCAWLQEMLKKKEKKLKLKAFLLFCLHLVVLRASLPWHSLNIENVNICLRKVLYSVEKKLSIFYLLNKTPGCAEREMTKRWPAHTITLPWDIIKPPPTRPFPAQCKAMPKHYTRCSSVHVEQTAALY